MLSTIFVIRLSHVCYCFCSYHVYLSSLVFFVLALDLEGVHDVKLHHPSSSVATSNQ